MRAQLSTRDYEQLSAYLDGQLAPGERKKLEERLRARPELQTALDELNQTRVLLRSAPRRRAPRNFTLTPAMVGDTGPSRKRARGGFFSLFPVMGFASAVATILLIATIVFDLSAGREPIPLETAMQQPEMETGAPEAGIMEAPAAEQEFNQGDRGADPDGGPVVIWGAPDSRVFEQAPGYPGGMGGGAPDDLSGLANGKGGGPVANMGGGAPDGTILLPPEAVESLQTPDSAVPSPATTPAAEDSAPQTLGAVPEEESDLILGAPADDTAGMIIGKSSHGQPVPGIMEEPLAVGERPAAGDTGEVTIGTTGETSLWDRNVLGLTFLRWVQILLVLIALATGAAALVLRRRTHS